ncbi:MAG: hypothetical protein MZV64_35635 [Ignavibacteriales bacterium]|nr:hypothetical protein [Ignavibacteriales bacterium]
MFAGDARTPHRKAQRENLQPRTVEFRSSNAAARVIRLRRKDSRKRANSTHEKTGNRQAKQRGLGAPAGRALSCS